MHKKQKNFANEIKGINGKEKNLNNKYWREAKEKIMD